MMHHHSEETNNRSGSLNGHNPTAAVITHGQSPSSSDRVVNLCCSGCDGGGCQCGCDSCKCNAKPIDINGRNNVRGDRHGNDPRDTTLVNSIQGLGSSLASLSVGDPANVIRQEGPNSYEARSPPDMALTHENLRQLRYTGNSNEFRDLVMLRHLQEMSRNPPLSLTDYVEEEPTGSDLARMIDSESLDTSMLGMSGFETSNRSVDLSEYDSAWARSSAVGSNALLGTGAAFNHSFLRLTPTCRHPDPDQGYHSRNH